MKMWRALSAWPDPSALFRAIGAEAVQQRAAKGDREAQFSQGHRVMNEGASADGLSGAAGRSPKVEEGLTHKIHLPVAHQTEMRRWSPDHRIILCVRQP